MEVPSSPQSRVLIGASLGGLASACAALNYPEDFGTVLSQSSSFFGVPKPDNLTRKPNGDGPNWGLREITSRPVQSYPLLCSGRGP